MKKILILFALVSFNFVAYSTVIYLNIPDTVVSTNGGFYDLDIDQNAIVDFKIDLRFPVSLDHNQVTVIHQGTNQVGVESTLGWLGKLSWNLNLNNSIDETLSSWMTSGIGSPNEIFLAYYGGSTNNGGAFLNQEGYVPLRFKIGSNTHYGWVRVAINANCTEFTVKDFAYENTPNTAIVAGNTGSVGLDEMKNTLYKVYPNPTTGLLNIEFSKSEIEEMNIFSIDGQHIDLIEQNLYQLNLKDYGSGQYIAVFHLKNESIKTEKIIVK